MIKFNILEINPYDQHLYNCVSVEKRGKAPGRVL